MALHEVKAPMAGAIWMLSVAVGEKVFEGGQLMVMESMKLEVPVTSPVEGIVISLAAPGTYVAEDETVAVVEG